MTDSIQPQADTLAHRGAEWWVARAIAVLAALLFIQHGVVHFMGFACRFGLAGSDAVNDGYTLVAALDPDGWTMRALGVAWLLPSPLYLVASAGLVLRRNWWQAWALAATVVSLALCILWLQPAAVGIAVDITILVGLAVYVVLAHRSASCTARSSRRRTR